MSLFLIRSGVSITSVIEKESRSFVFPRSSSNSSNAAPLLLNLDMFHRFTIATRPVDMTWIHYARLIPKIKTFCNVYLMFIVLYCNAYYIINENIIIVCRANWNKSSCALDKKSMKLVKTEEQHVRVIKSRITQQRWLDLDNFLWSFGDEWHIFDNLMGMSSLFSKLQTMIILQWGEPASWSFIPRSWSLIKSN